MRDEMILEFAASQWPRVIEGRQKFIVRPDGLVLILDRVGKGDRWATRGSALWLHQPRPVTCLASTWEKLQDAKRRQTCGACGSTKPADQSCGCFDNNCQ